MRCAKPHKSSECPGKGKDSFKPKCTNCNGEHVAASRECPKYKEQFQKQTEKAKARQEKVQNSLVVRGITFSNIVKNNSEKVESALTEKIQTNHSLDSLQHVLNTFDLFSKYSSLKINVNKSEISWIGKWKNKADNPNNLNLIDLNKETIKILGIHYSYNKKLMNERNFMKAFSNFKTVLNMWKTRQLTIYGRLEVVRSLAISKIMYVLNMLDPPKGFCKDVQNAINGFVWKNKTAKVKYSTAVGMYIDGSLKLPNIDIRYKTQRIMWMSNLISKYNGTVKNLLNQICKDIGGLQNVSFNFDIDCLPKRCEPFYISCFREWECIFSFYTIQC